MLIFDVDFINYKCMCFVSVVGDCRIFNYSLPMYTGRLSCMCEVITIVVSGTSTRTESWPVVDRCFKCLILLSVGENKVQCSRFEL